MSISYEQVLKELANLTKNGRIATSDKLRNLANSVSVETTGSITVLYGGDLADGQSASAFVKEMAAKDSSLRVISNIMMNIGCHAS